MAFIRSPEFEQGVSQKVQIGLYVGLITSAGLTCAALALQSLPTDAIGTLAVLVVASAISQFATVSLFGPTSVSLSFPLAFLALLWFGPGAAIIVNAAAVSVHAFYPTRRPLHKVAFNFGGLSIAAFVASAAYVAAGGHHPSESLVSDLSPTVIAAIVYFFTNTLTIAGAVNISSGQPVLEFWNSNQRWFSLYYVGLALGALLVATTFDRGDNLGFLLFIPALAVPWTFTRLCVIRAKELMEKRRRVQQLNVLQRVGSKANSSHGLEEILDTVLNGAQELSHADALAVFLRPKCGKRLQIASQVGLDDNPRVTQEPRVDEVDLEGFQGDAPIITKSKHLLPFEPSGDGSEATDPAAVYLPLRVEDRLIGAIGLYFEGDPGQSGEDLKLLGALGEYATAAADRQDKSNELEISRKRVFQNQEAVKKQVSGSLHGPVQTRLLVVWHRLGQLEAEMEDRSGVELRHTEETDTIA